MQVLELRRLLVLKDYIRMQFVRYRTTLLLALGLKAVQVFCRHPPNKRLLGIRKAPE